MPRFGVSFVSFLILKNGHGTRMGRPVVSRLFRFRPKCYMARNPQRSVTFRNRRRAQISTFFIVSIVSIEPFKIG